MNNCINDPNSWWHKQEVIPVEYGCDFGNGQDRTARVLFTKKEGKIIIEDLDGNDITENVILTFPGGNVVKAEDYIRSIIH